MYSGLKSIGLHPTQVLGEVSVYIMIWLMLEHLLPAPESSTKELLKWLIALTYIMAKTFAVLMTGALRGRQSRKPYSDPEDRLRAGG